MKKLTDADYALLKSRGKVVDGFNTVREDAFAGKPKPVTFRFDKATPKSSKNIIIDEVQRVYQEASKIWNRDFPIPYIKFTKRGRVAGTANWTTDTLNFNMVLFNENREDFLGRTVPHECAHLIARELYLNRNLTSWKKSIKPHGNEWKSVMTKLGYVPSRCHSYDTTNARVFHKAKYVYKCWCKTLHTVSIVRHRKALRGITYRCNKCKRPLVFVKSAGKVSHEDAVKNCQ